MRVIQDDEDLNFIVHIIFGILVVSYGDYGTSPRFGWFEYDEVRADMVDDFKEEIEYLKRRMEVNE